MVEASGEGEVRSDPRSRRRSQWELVGTSTIGTPAV